MQLISVVMTAIIATTTAHMSMQFPFSRNTDADGNAYLVWQSNEPMWPVHPSVCHGLPSKAVPKGNKFAAGEVITLTIEGTATHYGGHCSFWYSLDDVYFTKIADVKDCTLNANSTQVQIPETLPVECGDKCTFAWSWVPTVSQECEVYSNCADIKVTGLTGETEETPQTFNFQDIIDKQQCQLVKESTHWTDLFQPIKEQGTFGPQPTNLPADTTTTTRSPTTLEPVDPNSGNIIIENLASNAWWYSLRVDNVADGYDLESVAVISNGNDVLTACTLDMSSGSPVYQCEPSTALQLPLTVRVTSLVDNEELVVEGINVVTTFADGAQFDLGSNFDGNVVPPTPSTSSSISSTSTTSSITTTSDTATSTSASTTSTTSDTATTSSTATSSTTTGTSSTSMSTSTTLSTSSTSSTEEPVPSGDSITVQNTGAVSPWWYAGEVEGVNAGYSIEVFEIKGSCGAYFFCTDSHYGAGKLVYGCRPTYELVYPLSVRITGSDGHLYEALDAILNKGNGNIFDLGINIGNGVPINPTPPPTSTTTTSATSSPTKSPTSEPTAETTADHTMDPTTDPTLAPTSDTTATPTSEPTAAPTSDTTAAPTSEPTATPTSEPTAAPTTKPTSEPTMDPTTEPQDSTSTTTTTLNDDAVHKEIIAYYASWQRYDRENLAAPMNLDFNKVTIVNFAFFQPDTEGNLFGTDDWADPQVLFGSINWNPPDSSEDAADYRCHRGLNYPSTMQKICEHYNLEEGLIHLVHEADARIFPSIGGWTLSDNFPQIAADPIKRKHFAAECVGLIEDYGFDGIDLDWEYPAYTDHSGTPDDTQNFVYLLQEVRDALDTLGKSTGKYYEITAAVGCGPSTIEGYDIAATAPLLDQINLMTYDFFGGWSTVSGANAPLYYQGFPDGYEEWSVDGCVANWKEGGATNDQLNIGLPFYGQSFAGASGPNQGHDGSDEMHWPDDEGKPQYFNIETRLDEMTVVRDDVSMTQQAWFNDGSGYLSFDDEQAICDKVEYVIDQQLNGFIIWEISGDVRADLSTPLLDEVNMKLDYPQTHVCGSDDN